MMEMEKRPPFVTFEVRAEEDRAASVAQGHFVAKDVIYAIITPIGSKDRYEQEVSVWFNNLKEEVRTGRFPQRWLDAYEATFAAWKRNEEPPVDGTPLRNWPVISPAQFSLLKSLHLRSVEDLAAANEETIGRMGFGGRQLVAKAQAWLKSAQDVGKVSEQLVSLQTTVESQARLIEDLNRQLRERPPAAAPAVPTPQPQGNEPLLTSEDLQAL